MTRLHIAAILSIVLALTAKIMTVPETVTVAVNLPPVESTPFEEVIATNVAEPKYVPIPVSYTDEDRDCLTRNIYFEAKNQSIHGQLAVGIVTLKRVSSSRFPNDICGVVTQTKYFVTGTSFPERDKCQFSWYCDGKPDRPVEKRAYLQAQSIANALLSRESKFIDFTNGADHYHADYIDPPYWTEHMVKTAVIENHIFYSTAL